MQESNKDYVNCGDKTAHSKSVPCWGLHNTLTNLYRQDKICAV
jgi:hypothetical protein